MSDQACENTDRPLFENDQGSVHVTKGGEGLGINVGGLVITLPLKTWHALASGAPRPEALPTPAQEEVRERILAERAKGNIVVFGIEGMMSMPLEEFVKQPAEGILYDLNRSEEVVMTFIHEKKWVNDFAVAMTIRKLKAMADAQLPQK